MDSVIPAPGRPNGRALDEIVQDADKFYGYLKGRHVHDTRLDVAVVGLIVWFASFAVLGFGALATTAGKGILYEYLVGAFLAGVLIGGAAAAATYVVRRRRGFKFAELGRLISKMKQGTATSEDGLHLMDAMHEASLVLRKRKLDSAFEYGVLAFVGVSIIGMNAAAGALGGVVVYLYFRFEAMRGYEREDSRYQESKLELAQSL